MQHILMMKFANGQFLQERGSKDILPNDARMHIENIMRCRQANYNHEMQVPEISPSVRISSTWYA
jgi:hypothetical protein